MKARDDNSNMKKLRRWFLLLVIVGMAVVCLLPKSEYTFEFDGVNLRLRDCSRYRSWLLEFVLWEECSLPQDHPTAVRLRELSVLGDIREAKSQWLLIKGFTKGVRGWIGPGRNYVRALGATTFGTPVTLPAEEDLSQNLWIKWAIQDPAAARHFWQELQAIALRTEHSGYYLEAAKDYLLQHQMAVVGSELEAYARRVIEVGGSR